MGAGGGGGAGAPPREGGGGGGGARRPPGGGGGGGGGGIAVPYSVSCLEEKKDCESEVLQLVLTGAWRDTKTRETNGEN